MNRAGRDFDVIVIGGGTAGMTVAREVARGRKWVALIEADRTGGDCLYTGCVPSKSYLATAHLAHRMRRSSELGIVAGPVEVDFDTVRRRTREVIVEIEREDDVAALEADGVRVIAGRARFVGPNEVEVEGERLRAGEFVVATGSLPAVPPIPGLNEAGYCTNETIWEIEQLPGRLLVIGGGAIGVELGQAFSRFGFDVVIVERDDRLLPRDDIESAQFLQDRLALEGIGLRTDTQVSGVRGEEGRRIATLFASNGKTEELVVDEILVATGRRNAIDDLGLDSAGVRVDEGTIVVDERLRTSVEHIWACGDVIGPPYLTHAAHDQGWVVAQNLLGKREKWSARAIPWVTFTDPEAAGVGMTEELATARYKDDLEILELPFDRIDRALTDGTPGGFIKVLLAPGWNAGTLGGEIVGAHIVGANAGEVIQQFALSMRWRLPAGLLAKTVLPYPTYGIGARQAIGKHWLDADGAAEEWTLNSRIRSFMQGRDPVEWVRRR